MRFVIS